MESINDAKIKLGEKAEDLEASAWGEFLNSKKPVLIVVFSIPVLLSMFHLYTCFFGVLEPYKQRAIHLIAVLLIVFLCENIWRTYQGQQKNLSVAGIMLTILTLGAGLYIYLEYDNIIVRFAGPLLWDYIIGTILIILVLEAARRTIGLVIPVVAIVFMCYPFLGQYIPGPLGHKGLSYAQFIQHMFLQPRGLFGISLGVAATFIIVFIIFGAFLAKSGAGDFFIKLARALSGKSAGGPAKTAVLASALMASVSGSAVSNVVTTGSLTIPLMIKHKYDPEFAGAVESSSSLAGTVMPPVMCATSFLIAQFTETPYVLVILYALVPALLFIFSVYMAVHFESYRLGLQPLGSDDVASVKETLREGGHFLLPIVALVVMLAIRITPMRAGAFAIVLMVVLSWLRKETRMGWSDVIEALELGARNALIVSVTCAAAGLIVGSITFTGLGVKLSSIILHLAGGNIYLLLLFVMLSCIVLGMGMPIVPAYLIVMALGVPALHEAGIPLVVAHFFVFHYANVSAITPPVALTSYAGAAIAKADPVRTSLKALKIAFVAFLVPWFFALDPRLMLIGGTVAEYALVITTAIIGVAGLAAALSGWFLVKLEWWERLVFFVAGISMIHPNFWTDMVGIVLILVGLIGQLRKKRLQSVFSSRH